MATPSGTIGLSDVNAELGFSPTALISMNDAAVRTLAGVPTGTISMQNLQNKSNRVSIPLTISGNTYNYDVYNSRGPTYNPGKSDITVTINPGVLVGSTSTGTFAFSIPSAFNPADTITVVNNGTIQGMGGAGGRGGGPGASPSNGLPGASGGTALRVQRPATITNNGTIAGGGGGGGGGLGAQKYDPESPSSGSSCGGGGGGGGAGRNGGGGGAGGPATSLGPSFTVSPGSPGSSGTSPAGGGGGTGGTGSFPISQYAAGTPGGSGGGRGASGSAGSPSASGFSTYGSVGSGGGAGAYISGLPFVTWPATGTRQGPSS